MARTSEITPEQAATIRAYAADHGRCWKAQLRQDWMRAGTDWRGGDYCFLQQLRNSHGPGWLIRFRISGLS